MLNNKKEIKTEMGASLASALKTLAPDQFEKFRGVILHQSETDYKADLMRMLEAGCCDLDYSDNRDQRVKTFAAYYSLNGVIEFIFDFMREFVKADESEKDFFVK